MSDDGICTLATRRQGRDLPTWVMLLGMFGGLTALQFQDPFRIALEGLVVPSAFLVALAATSFFYSRVRPDQNIVAMVVGLQQMILFSTIGAMLSYMVAARGHGLWDERMAGWDRAIGFDWISYLHWTDRHSGVAEMLKQAYDSLMAQMVAVIVALGLYRRLSHLRTVIFGAILAGLVMILFSGLMPAVGNYVYLHLSPSDYPNIQPSASFVHLDHFMGLRDGSLRLLSLPTMQGIITFPSYHAGLATVFAWGFLKVPHRLVRWPGFIVAALTLVATPINGGHYIVDVIAGCVVAGLSLSLAHYVIHMDISPGNPFLRRRLNPALLRSSPSRHSHAASAR